MTLTWHVGDTRKVLATLAPGSVNCVVTSSPYLAKRAYLPGEHPLKPFEQGQEASPAEFLAGMLEVTDLLWDVLADDGVAFLNYGDTASGSGGAGGDYNEGGKRDGQARYIGSGRRRLDVDAWPSPKSICWVPELLGASLAYGRNLLTGDPHRKWITRPPVIWCKPAVMPGRCDDKFREATELVLFIVKQPNYWFDLDPVRTPQSDHTLRYPREQDHYKNPGYDVGNRGDKGRITAPVNPKGAPPLTWQVIATAQYDGAHFAVMPPTLARLLITVGCPPGGTVLDPYAGSGTTLDAAHSLSRSAVGIDIDERNVALAQDRLGMFPIEIIDHPGAVA